jgi:hypothetical protein
MQFTADEYRNALYRLEYIAMVKARLRECLLLLAAPSASRMPIAQAEYAHACGGIDDTIDDLYHAHATLARQVKDAVERESWRRAVEEWRVP